MTRTNHDLALSRCAEEPIHIPGAIQSHGVMLVLSRHDERVLQVSENVETILGRAPQRVLGRPLSDVLALPGAVRLNDWIEAGEAAYLEVAVALEAGRIWFDARGHRRDELFIVELENPRVEREESRFQDTEVVQARLLTKALSRLSVAGDVVESCEYLAKEVRAFTGFDRVMIYRFHEDMHGEVIAEARADDVDSFLGLHYPASDIPEQARRLYRENWLRLIADVEYTPARLIPEINPLTKAPLDMSEASLRSVSPVHLQYLRNMEVGSSMSISLMKGDDLWGLIACHHRSAHYVSQRVRSACELLGVVMSVQLATKENSDQALKEARRQTLQAEILRSISEKGSLLAITESRQNALLELVGADGAVVQFGGDRRVVGTVPEEERVDEVIQWLGGRDQEEALFVTDQLSAHFPAAEEFAAAASGLLALELQREVEDWILFFRPEAQRTVAWAGNPEKPVEQSKQGELRPRESFSTWKQSVSKRSWPFSSQEVAAAHALRQALLTHIIERARELQRAQDELEKKKAEMSSFAYVATHDLKEPLRSLEVYARYLEREFSDRLGEAGQIRVKGMLRLTSRMDALLDSLMQYTEAGHVEHQRKRFSLHEVLQEALEIVQARRQEKSASIEVPRPLPEVWGEPMQVREVLANLLSNALKYNDKDKVEIEVGYLTPEEHREGDETYFFVRDNGIGIKPRYQGRIFDLFRRLHGREAYGGGTGAGLAIVKRIVERHGGRVWVESEPGVGTTFFFTLGRI